MLRKLFLFTIVAMNVTSNVACSDISGDANNGSAANSVTVATLQLLDAEKTVGHVEIYDDAALKFIDLTTKVSIRGEGYAWLEGPVWIEDGQYLLFSDIPNNLIAKYQPNVGTSVYLEKSGATGLYPGDYDAGSNGLLLNSAGQLVLLQQGDRRVAVMDAPLDSPTSRFKTLTEKYQGQRLNSPNDAVYHPDGSLFFTDPPYGLKNIMEDVRKEISFQGIYRLSQDGQLTLLDDQVTYPNGIGISPDGKTLYVAVSDKKNPVWFAYDILANGEVTNKRVFYDASEAMPKDGKHHTGLPDGMAVHSSGHIFATGPDGVWLFDKQGKVLAKVFTGQLTANCTLTTDEKYLFITADDYLMSIALK